MPLRSLGENVHERDPFRAADYTAPPEAVEAVRAWYAGGRLDAAPEGYEVQRHWHEAGRTHVVLGGHDWLVEASYEPSGAGLLVAGVAPDRAYRYALHRDDELKEKGWTVYNERHPRP